MLISKQQALDYHNGSRPGKIEVTPTKPCRTQRDLSLAYTPGVAEPCLEIQKNPRDAFKYTGRGNLVAVLSNGTAVLGLGAIGALAGKPVMEGKAVLSKRFGDVDVFDIDVNSRDPEEIIKLCQLLEPTFGGINLEDIKAPDCFQIEEALRKTMKIPVFHDDQHGTAIISGAALLNALEVVGKDIHTVRVVFNGAGAAGIACAEHYVRLGVKRENIILCDTKGVVYRGRKDGMNKYKERFAQDTKLRTLSEAMAGADVFAGLSVKDAISQDMVRSMAGDPIVFALANPYPEISYEDAKAARNDVIIATGRSDYPNQVNNVLGFPFIFRGALDVRAKTINMEMKIAAAQALADLAREDVPDEVAAAYRGARPRFGRDYIIPVPFDPRLIHVVPIAVAKAAMASAVARRPIVDLEAYKEQLSARRDPIAGAMQLIIERVRRTPKRVVFAEGEEEQVIRAAYSFVNQGLGEAILVGREERVRSVAKATGLDLSDKGIEIHNARLSQRNSIYAQFLYERLQRKGYLFRDCQRMINQDRNYFAAAMVARGDADAIVTGVTRNFSIALEEVRRVIDDKPGHRVVGVSIILSRGRPILAADTAIAETPTAEDLAEIAIEAAGVARRLGYEPRVAMLAFSNFGHPPGERALRVQEAVRILDAKRVDFEYDGEMGADVALNKELMAAYPFCRLKDTANVLIMPAFHSAAISTRMLQELGGATVIGPLIVGLEKPVQIVSLAAKDSDIVNMAAMASFNIGG